MLIADRSFPHSLFPDTFTTGRIVLFPGYFPGRFPDADEVVPENGCGFGLMGSDGRAYELRAVVYGGQGTLPSSLPPTALALP